jgi:ABC-type Fe3+ transport system permease subunit
LTRFAFLPAVLAWALSSAACETVDQARVEGANEMQALGYIRLPQVWRPLAGAALVVASLSLCEVATSATIQTASFFNGSLSVRVDNEMHYGREKSLIAMTLMLYVPAAMAAVAIPLIGRRSRMR